MRVILFGATGMVGRSVPRECLLDDGVEMVLAKALLIVALSAGACGRGASDERADGRALADAAATTVAALDGGVETVFEGGGSEHMMSVALAPYGLVLGVWDRAKRQSWIGQFTTAGGVERFAVVDGDVAALAANRDDVYYISKDAIWRLSADGERTTVVARRPGVLVGELTLLDGWLVWTEVREGLDLLEGPQKLMALRVDPSSRRARPREVARSRSIPSVWVSSGEVHWLDRTQSIHPDTGANVYPTQLRAWRPPQGKPTIVYWPYEAAHEYAGQYYFVRCDRVRQNNCTVTRTRSGSSVEEIVVQGIRPPGRVFVDDEYFYGTAGFRLWRVKLP